MSIWGFGALRNSILAVCLGLGLGLVECFMFICTMDFYKNPLLLSKVVNRLRCHHPAESSPGIFHTTSDNLNNWFHEHLLMQQVRLETYGLVAQ